MNVKDINDRLFRGQIDVPGLFPHLEALALTSPTFRIDFGLETLPDTEGVLLVRGARQYGKSTWLEGKLRESVVSGGPASAFYLNGDELHNVEALIEAIRAVAPLYRTDAPFRRLFIDEITAVRGWERGVKLLVDSGELRGILLITTGSKATDLRRGAERLPGRKGRLERTGWLFTPIPFVEFARVAAEHFGEDTMIAYLLSGGCPVAAAELVRTGRLPEYVVEMVRDWVLGECAAAGRDRSSLLAAYEVILRRGGTPVGQAALAREAGLANNTVAAGYVELLADLMCLARAHAWDASRSVAVRRRPAKFPPINLLAAVAFDKARLRTVEDYRALPPEVQGRWWEWLVAAEIWRRAALRGDLVPEQLLYWSTKEREIDYVLPPSTLVEVKRGRVRPFEFSWFPRTFPGAELRIVNTNRFEADRIRGLTMEDLLRDDGW